MDAAIFMPGNAYNIVNHGVSDGVYPNNICSLRFKILDSLVAKNVRFLPTAAQLNIYLTDVSAISATESTRAITHGSNNIQDPRVSRSHS